MNAEIKERWITALRSGKYKQGKSFLRADDSYCCLGVLCELAQEEGIISCTTRQGIHYEEEKFYVYGGSSERDARLLPLSVVTWADLPGTDPRIGDTDTRKTLSWFNDRGYSFMEIADMIENHL